MLKKDRKESLLWSKAIAQTQYALKCGALETIATEYQFIEQNRINFLVRILANLVRKDEANKKQKDFNPFLPYEKDLLVADLSDTHVCILNKYNVVPHHLLMITRDFEEQESWLTIQDFEALWTTLAEVDGLAFYNGGKIAGASQRHKHLQLVPFPLIPNGASLPIEPALLSSQCQNSVEVLSTLPFRHAFIKFDLASFNSPLETARMTLEYYQALLESVGLSFEGDRQTGAYNLLVTREWMLLVARSQESFESIAVNSLGFAGALLVRDRLQLERLKQHSPMKILVNVAFEK
ncbi:MAG: phosphorylase [Hydrococcus sp. Prado102]|nr:phosphorylase [Hydrococcus sp. Prado102]